MTDTVDTGRRHFLTVATVATGAVGAAFVAVPFLASWKPSARAKAMGAPVEVDIGKLEPGAMVKVEWRGKAIYVVHRTPQMLAQLDAVAERLRDPQSTQSDQPDFAKNPQRALKPEYLVLVGVCTHLGCSPQLKAADAKAEMGADWVGGFYCPCHGSKFDLAGRVFRGAPAPLNLVVPPYTLADGKLTIGEDQDTKGA